MAAEVLPFLVIWYWSRFASWTVSSSSVSSRLVEEDFGAVLKAISRHRRLHLPCSKSLHLLFTS